VKALGVSQQGLMRDSLPWCHSKAVVLNAQKAGVQRRTQVTQSGIVGGGRISLSVGLFCSRKMLSKMYAYSTIFACPS